MTRQLRGFRWLPTLAFLTAVSGAWAWFHVAPPPPGEDWRFVLNPSPNGWQFDEHPIAPNAQAILATTNLTSGVFSAPGKTPVTVFAAEWRAEAGQSMNVVQHTPDVCWVGSGWIPANLGQPDRVSVTLDGRPVSFESRVFAASELGPKVLVVWCTLVGGQVLEEADRWSTESDASADAARRFATAGRRMGIHQFMDNVRNRRLAAGRKQFVRLSVPVSSDWQSGLDDLQAFAPQWLELRTGDAIAGMPSAKSRSLWVGTR